MPALHHTQLHFRSSTQSATTFFFQPETTLVPTPVYFVAIKATQLILVQVIAEVDTDDMSIRPVAAERYKSRVCGTMF
jgi:hypothetical protein